VFDPVEAQLLARDGDQRFPEELPPALVLPGVLGERALDGRVVDVHPERQPRPVAVKRPRELVGVEPGQRRLDRVRRLVRADCTQQLFGTCDGVFHRSRVGAWRI